MPKSFAGTLAVTAVRQWVPVALLAVAVCGLILFQSGFLLTRTALPNVASFAPSAATPHDGSTALPQPHPRYKRLALLIIDAMRFDFVAPPAMDGGVNQNGHFHQQLNIMHELSQQHPGRSLLFRFVADAPTTTMQRLKALTTGNLPTFIDMGNNFAGTAIHEDNVIAQLQRNGFRMMFTGDDTWMGLYPTQFAEQHPYPSFDVWDLDTVDNGVLKHLVPAVRGDSRVDVLVAHFLGVDHAGHRYGPDHPAMRDKLVQMNGVLDDVVRALPNDTLLMVMGDHGMDTKGDHGGDSALEINSALWIYGNHDFYDAKRDASVVDALLGERPASLAETIAGWQRRRTIAQIDIVPTLALFLGIPIPFENLGAVIPELFVSPTSPDRSATLLSYVRENARQVHRYLDEYARASPAQFPAAVMQQLFALFEQAEGAVHSGDVLGTAKLYVQFLQETLAVTRSVWAQFDVARMTAGVAMMLLAMVSTLWWIRTSAMPSRGSGMLGLLLPLALPLLTAYTYVTNSFILFEDGVSLFCLVLSIVAFASVFKAWHRALAVVVALVAARLSGYITVCREEQMPYCRPTFYESESRSVASVWMTVLVLCGLLALVFGWTHVRRAVYGRHLAAPAKLWTWSIRVTALLCVLYWWTEEIVHGHATVAPTTRIDVIWMARACFAGSLVSLLLLVLRVPAQSRTPACFLLCGYLFLVPTQKPPALYSLTLAVVIVLCLASLSLRQPPSVVAGASATAAVIFHLSRHVYYTTGHQATLSSIQWNAGFTGLSTMNYYLSSTLVALNLIGPSLLALLAQLVVNVSANTATRRLTVWLLVWLELLHVLVSSAMAAHLRRHLMVWKVFAPRWMLAALFLAASCVVCAVCLARLAFSSSRR
ncbi:mannose-ethanolamine phosphotransferase gpi13 [Sorochytrium milnesiophthora]